MLDGRGLAPARAVLVLCCNPDALVGAVESLFPGPSDARKTVTLPLAAPAGLIAAGPTDADKTDGGGTPRSLGRAIRLLLARLAFVSRTSTAAAAPSFNFGAGRALNAGFFHASSVPLPVPVSVPAPPSSFLSRRASLAAFSLAATASPGSLNVGAGAGLDLGGRGGVG